MSDPYLSREEMRYKNPIASREFIVSVLEASKKPLLFSQILKRTHTESAHSEALKKRLNAMLRDGQLRLSSSQRYSLKGKIKKLQGSILRLKDGSVQIVQADETLLDVPFDHHIVLHNDIVTYRKVTQGTKSHGVIIDIVQRAHETLLGLIDDQDESAYFYPFMRGLPRMRIVKAARFSAWEPLSVVRARVEVKARGWQATLLRLEGHMLDPHVPEMIAKHVADLDSPVDPQMEASLAHLAPPSLHEPHRLDWRDKPFVTIDGATARDFDDAVMAEAQDDGSTLLYVAIADVAAYIPCDSPLDLHAYQRTTSVYFPKACIPMLPERLSNDLCSLMPHQARYAMGVRMHLNAQGEIIEGSIHEVLIQSHARFTYEEVQAMLDGVQETPSWFSPSLQAMKSLTDTLIALAYQRRALTLLSQIEQSRFDEEGHWLCSDRHEASFAHGLIEKMMVTTNHFVARFLRDQQAPTLYRHHPEARAEGIESLMRELRHAQIDTSIPQDLFALNEHIRQHPTYALLAPWIIRAMAQARYEPEMTYHTGLSLDAYVHFTSPIRRYPDLMVHRALKAILHGQTAKLAPAPLEAAARRCSRLERRADSAVYDAMDLYQCQWMFHHLDEIHQGHVLSHLSFGVFVKIEHSGVEVLLHAQHLESWGFTYDTLNSRWSHPHLPALHLGATVQVCLYEVAFLTRRRDATLVQIDNTPL